MLDVLAGRRDGVGTTEGDVLVDGQDRKIPAVQRYFMSSTAYMLQLAEAYSAGLTVRENLAYSALMRLPVSKMTMEDKMDRVEQGHIRGSVARPCRRNGRLPDRRGDRREALVETLNGFRGSATPRARHGHAVIDEIGLRERADVVVGGTTGGGISGGTTVVLPCRG
eukprot:9230940-Pyramimonas_sp.AAC.1